jgi:hypothetical protein
MHNSFRKTISFESETWLPQSKPVVYSTEFRIPMRLSKHA